MWIIVHYWCELRQPLGKTTWKFLQRLNIELFYDLVIPILDMCPEDLKAGS
jgi:hypothetical protein